MGEGHTFDHAQAGAQDGHDGYGGDGEAGRGVFTSYRCCRLLEPKSAPCLGSHQRSRLTDGPVTASRCAVASTARIEVISLTRLRVSRVLAVSERSCESFDCRHGCDEMRTFDGGWRGIVETRTGVDQVTANAKELVFGWKTFT
jgi:hypothetical protein